MTALNSLTNDCFRVETPGGRKILKVYRAASAGQVALELRLLGHLQRAGLPAGSPVLRPDGSPVATLEGRPACLLSELPGRPFPPPLAPADTHWLGGVLGWVQAALADFPESQAVSGALLADYGETQRRWEDWLSVVEAAVADPMRDEFLAMIDETMMAAERVQLHRVDWPALGVQPLHGDYHAGNVLQAGGQLTGILDLEHARNGPRLFDIATACCVMLINPYEEPERSIERVQAFIRGYRTTAAFSPAEWELFPAAISLERWADFRILERHFQRGDSTLDRFVSFDTAYLRWFGRHGDRLWDRGTS